MPRYRIPRFAYPSCPVPWAVVPHEVCDALEYIDDIRLQLQSGRQATADVGELGTHLAALRGYVYRTAGADQVEVEG